MDQLTGLPGRWTTLERLRSRPPRRRYAHPVAVVLFDIDDFAELNHEHGRGRGCDPARARGAPAAEAQGDALGRIGADSYVAILPHTDEAGATAFANAVLDRLLERADTLDEGHPRHGGGEMINELLDDEDALIRQAGGTLASKEVAGRLSAPRRCELGSRSREGGPNAHPRWRMNQLQQ